MKSVNNFFAAFAILICAQAQSEEKVLRVLKDHLQKGSSPFEQCKTGKLYSSKVKEIQNTGIDEKYLVVEDEIPTLMGGDDQTSTVEWRGDANDDKLTDLLVDRHGCGNDGACVYDLMIYCGEGKYVSVIRDEHGSDRGDYLMDPVVTSESKVVGGRKWRRIKDSHGHFYDFDGKSYKQTL